MTAEDEREGVEPSRFPARPVLIFVGGVLLSLALVYALTGWIMDIPEEPTRDVRSRAEPWPMEDPDRPIEDWPPPLQPDPDTDYEVLRARQLERLEDYGWIDREREIVHIPIDQAIDLVLELDAVARDEVEVGGEGGS